MKTKAIFFSILFIASGLLMAQRSGIKGGANFSNLYVDDVSDENLKLGLNLGIWHQTEGPVAIQTEVAYSSKGAELVYNNVFGSGKYRFNLNYLEVPIMFVGKIGAFQLHAGPYAGFLVGSNIKDVDSDGDINNIESLDTDDFHRFDYGLVGGAALDFETGMVGARYNYGLREVGKSGSFAGEALNNSKNAGFQIFVAFDF
ncbi:MAG: porin family protein [Ekhidna sp.]|uniref:porin family protein n=1 Tax=Ekhidna sp. TaxID=2608089 RepID=UPI0032F05E5F